MKCSYLKLDPQGPSHCFIIRELIALAIGSPTPEKIKNILDQYDDPQHHLLGYFNEDNLIGLIGLQTKKNHGVIKHIAVLQPHQSQGMGKMLIRQTLSYWQLQTCEAETDNEGKGFYEKLGFVCDPFKGPYNIRYQCKWERS